MDHIRLRQVPIAKTGMLIRRPAADVFEAFVNPDITTKFWFTKSSGRLEAGKAALRARLQTRSSDASEATAVRQWLLRRLAQCATSSRHHGPCTRRYRGRARRGVAIVGQQRHGRAPCS
jgi:hypothetical protein